MALNRRQKVGGGKAYQRCQERIKEITDRSWGLALPRRLAAPSQANVTQGWKGMRDWLGNGEEKL
jgi:hypothetical protein